MMESHSPSQEDRQLWSCRETGVTAALLEEGVPRGASSPGGGTGWGGVEKELPRGAHTEGWSVSGTRRSGSRARRRLRALV